MNKFGKILWIRVFTMIYMHVENLIILIIQLMKAMAVRNNLIKSKHQYVRKLEIERMWII